MSESEPTAVSDFGIVCPRMADIMKAVSAETNIPVFTIVSNRRDALPARPRQIFCWVARRTTLRSISEIGHYINRDHSTVANSIKIIDALCETDPDFWKIIDAIMSRLAA